MITTICLIKTIHYFLKKYLETLETSVLNKIYEIDPTHFLSAPGLAWQACLKKTEIQLELLTNIVVVDGLKINQRRNIPCNTYVC